MGGPRIFFHKISGPRESEKVGNRCSSVLEVIHFGAEDRKTRRLYVLPARCAHRRDGAGGIVPARTPHRCRTACVIRENRRSAAEPLREECAR